MNGRRPQDPEAIIRRLRASLDDRAGDHRITPAFAERVRRLRQRRRVTLRVVQTMAVAIVLAVAGAGILESLRPSRRMDFVSPPPVTASPTSAAPSQEPSEAPSQPAAEDLASSFPPPDAEPRVDAEPAPAESPDTDGADGDDGGHSEPVPTRVILDGEPRPGAVCRDDDTTLIATIELPEAETGYVIDLTEPVTMRIMSEGVTDVSDAVEVATDGDRTAYTATFTTDANDFEVNEVRIEGPTDPPAC